MLGNISNPSGPKMRITIPSAWVASTMTVKMALLTVVVMMLVLVLVGVCARVVVVQALAAIVVALALLVIQCSSTRRRLGCSHRKNKQFSDHDIENVVLKVPKQELEQLK